MAELIQQTIGQKLPGLDIAAMMGIPASKKSPKMEPIIGHDAVFNQIEQIENG